MVEQELYYDGSTTVRHYDSSDGLVPTSATLTLTKPDGSTVGTYVVTLPSLSTTVQSGTTATALVLASVAGLSRGKHIKVTSDGVDYVTEVARVDGTAVHLTAALPVVPDTGSTVKALDMSATVTAPGSALVGSGLRLTWVYDDGTTTRRAGYPASVVRWPWVPPVTAEDVRELLAASFNTTRSESFCQRVADKVADRIRAAVINTGRRPWLHVSGEVFRPVAEVGIRLALAEEGLALGGQVMEAVREYRFAFQDGLASTLTGAQYDKDQDGTLSESERKPFGYSIRVVR